jgi:choice-of-anchor A domain-containing protein
MKHRAIRNMVLRPALGFGLLSLIIAAASPTRATAWEQGPVSSTPCPFLFADLGDASAFSVLELDAHKVTFSSGAIKGDVGIGPNGRFQISGSSVVGGTLSLSPGATYSRSGSACVANVVTNADLSSAISDAENAAMSFGQASCDQSLGSVRLSGGGSEVVSATHDGQNIVCADAIDLSGKSVVDLDDGGFSNVTFVVNISGKFQLSGGSRMDTSGDIEPQDVLYNVLDTGPAVSFSGGSVINGTVLAPDRSISPDAGIVRGAVISGMEIVIASGEQICPNFQGPVLCP